MPACTHKLNFHYNSIYFIFQMIAHYTTGMKMSEIAVEHVIGKNIIVSKSA